MLSQQQITTFQEIIYEYYREHRRSFPWRWVDNAYYVVISEIMLQQTQTYRVQEKYELFITTFPDIQNLAEASLKDVLAVWQGLGYNRRAQALHTFAQRVVTEFGGAIPEAPELLKKFKGIGDATAGSICAFAFNKPTVFIETNIRAVFIHFFFADKEQINDKEIEPLVSQTIDNNQPRQWYYALMDYGVMLKKQCDNPSKKSAHYSKQSKFEGSDRQIRGMLLKLLLQHESLSLAEIIEHTRKEPKKVTAIVNDMVSEKFIERQLDKLILVGSP